MPISIKTCLHLPLPPLCSVHKMPITSYCAQIVENKAIRIDTALVKVEEWQEEQLRNQKHNANLTKKHPEWNLRLQTWTPLLLLLRRFVSPTRIPMDKRSSSKLMQIYSKHSQHPPPPLLWGPTPIEPYSTETLELEGWMATYDVKDLPGTTIPSMPITSEDFVLFVCTQASTGFKMITSMPFKFDSGASAPISLIHKDFIN